MDTSPGRGFVAAPAYEEISRFKSVTVQQWMYRSVEDAAALLQGRTAGLQAQVAELQAAPALSDLLVVVERQVKDIIATSDVFGGDAASLSQDALQIFQQAVPNPVAQEWLMRSAGISDVLCDLIRGPMKKQGAEFALQFNSRLALADSTLGQEVWDILGANPRVRVLEDVMSARPKYQFGTVSDTPELGRQIVQGLDEVLDNGVNIDFKSYKSWANVKYKIERQAPRTLLRYADQGFKDSTGKALNRQFVYFIDDARLIRPAASNLDQDARNLGDALTQWANRVFQKTVPADPDIRFYIFIR